jgi:thiol:disulfide interchange protein DsbC
MMNRNPVNYLRLLIATAMLVSAATSIAADADPKLEAARAKITGMFESIAPEDVDVSPIEGWYTVKSGPIIAYISDDGHYLMQGDLIDLDTEVNLTEAVRTDARRELMSALSDDETIMFSPAEVKHTVTVFTDIDCSYCRKLHSQIDDYMDLGIEIRYVLYPRAGPASRAWTTSEEVLCASDRGSALTAAKLDREFETTKCDTRALTRNYTLGRDVGLTGTPAIVLEDGTFIGGYLSPEGLSMRIERSSPH